MCQEYMKDGVCVNRAGRAGSVTRVDNNSVENSMYGIEWAVRYKA